LVLLWLLEIPVKFLKRIEEIKRIHIFLETED